jgi:hypothetical protein
MNIAYRLVTPAEMESVSTRPWRDIQQVLWLGNHVRVEMQGLIGALCHNTQANLA